MNTFRRLRVLGLLLGVLPLAAENEIGFIEQFALAPDRAAVLDQLVPGTEDYYHFHALHYEQTGQVDRLKALLGSWAARFPESARRQVIENRQALLAYDTDPDRTLRWLQERLGPLFDHVRVVPDQKPTLPTSLDPTRIARAEFLRKVLERDALEGLDLSEYPSLLRDSVPLNQAQRRHVLSQLQRPDLPGLVDAVVADLKALGSRGFGQHALHRQLLPDQLDALQKAMPELGRQPEFVLTRLRKLAPSADSSPVMEPQVREAWLERLWSAVKPLPSSFNSLKAHILHARLVFDRSRGVWDRDRFIEYLKLPRPAVYMSPRFLEESQAQSRGVDLNATFDLIGSGPVGSDDALVRDYLLQFAREDVSWEPWSEWLNVDWLKPVFAEAKITAGAPDPERWASLLSPAAYQLLRDRVDVEFPADSPVVLSPAEEVSLDVVLKNAPQVLVRLFEINTLGFFTTQNRQLNTDLNLDGLVANSEQTLSGDASPFRRVVKTLRFPELKGRRGAWIVEVIAGGRSSRALLRKGQYSLVQQTGAAGEWITPIDEAHQPLRGVSAWLNGRRFDPEKDGRILIPFTREPGRRQLVLADADAAFASLVSFDHPAETYRLEARFHLDREQVLPGQEATLAVRATLFSGKTPVALELLRNPRLTLRTETLDGVVSTAEIRSLKLEPGNLFLHPIRTPNRLARLTVELRGEMDSLTQVGQKIRLEAQRDWTLNGIQRTALIADVFLTPTVGAHRLDILGRNGEGIPDQIVEVQIFRRGFQQPEVLSLSSDESGRIQLSTLEGVRQVVAKLPGGPTRVWPLMESQQTWPEGIQVAAAERIQIPLPEGVEARSVSLLELRGGVFVADHSARIAVKDGVLDLGQPEAGDYSLEVNPGSSGPIPIRIVAGKPVGDWVVGASRSIERRVGRSLRIVSMEAFADTLSIRLSEWDPFTRIHVVATRFDPVGGLWTDLGEFSPPGLGLATPDWLPNLYTSGRRIGDEYRYILERRYAAKYPGNLLQRPGLILNPWELRTTESGTSALTATEAPQAMAGAVEGLSRTAALKREAADRVAPEPESSLDFLARPAPGLFNLRPDTNGVVRVPMMELGDRSVVQVHVENLTDAVWRTIRLPERTTAFQDMRLAQPLDPSRPMTEMRESLALQAGAVIEIPDITVEDFEMYDTLSSIHGLLLALSGGDPNLEKFEWALRWPGLSAEERRSRYSEFACHELNLFLSRKDPKFFKDVVEPYLRNKKDPTFLDALLLGRDLTRFLSPWSYGRLNAAERALLTRQLPGESEAGRRHLQELWENQKPDPEQSLEWFETALRGRSLDLASKPKALTALPTGNTPAAFDGPVDSVGGIAGGRGRDKMESRRFGRDSVALQDNKLLERSKSKNGRAETDLYLRKAGDSRALMELRVEEVERLREAVVRQAYHQPQGPTHEWAENNYYHRPLREQEASMIPVNGFWRDVAAWDGKAPFVSPRIVEAHRNFAEMFLALALLDLPFEAPRHQIERTGTRVRIQLAGPALVFRRRVQPALETAEGKGARILVSESFFRPGSEEGQSGADRGPRPVTGEFLNGVAYGSRVVVSNPEADPVRLDLLTQIPQGALPLSGSRSTWSRLTRLEPYSTRTFEYQFYFPAPEADRHHMPAQASMADRSVGVAVPTVFQAVRRLSVIDKTTWDYISQQGSEDEVFAYLGSTNLARIDLERVAWRCRESSGFLRKLTTLLVQRHVWSEPVFRYGLVHNDTFALREWLRHQDGFIARCGDALESPVLAIDPVERHSYEHLEYAPLTNPRAHRVGAERRIDNAAQRAQYQRLLGILSYRKSLSPSDNLALVYHLFLQDRVEEALARLKAVNPEAVDNRLQYDYVKCYASLYESDLSGARSMAKRHADHPVDRWRTRFREVLAQIDGVEARGGDRSVGPDTRDREEARLAAAESTFEFQVSGKALRLSWRNLAEVRINFYLMDPEFLFSSSPFATQDSARFGIIRPTESLVVRLAKGRESMEIPLPSRFVKANVLVEVVGGGRSRAIAHHSSSFEVLVAENHGYLDVGESGSGKGIPKAYVKVFARLPGGVIRFYKDGYTDLRGRFDYASLNEDPTGRPVPVTAAAEPGTYQAIQPSEVASVERFALLVLGEDQGAAIREVAPPRR